MDKLKVKYPDKKDSTLRSYLNCYNKIKQNVFPDDDIDINDKDKIFNFLNKEKINNKKVYLNGYIKCIKCFHCCDDELCQKYNEKYFQYCKESEEFRQYKKPSEKEKDMSHNISFDKLTTKRNELKASIINKNLCSNHIKYLTLSLYTLYPPLRPSEWCSCKVYARASRIKKLEDNYICLTTHKIVFNDYKTCKSYGKQEFKLPKELIQIIKEIRNLTQSKWLIPKIKNPKQHMSVDAFSKVLSRNCGCGASFLRKLYISNKIDEGLNGEERKELSKRMLHSASTQILTYSRFSEICNN